MTNTPLLKRSINLPLLTFYGLGTIVGGGIYALLGKVAGNAGMAMPLAFALAGFIALFSACSFAELCSRYPTSAGEASYVLKGFNNHSLSFITGVLVIFTGLVSAATLIVATTHFLNDMWLIPNSLTIIALSLLMGLVAIWGIGQSAMIIAIITVIEVGALVYICVINVDTLQTLHSRWPELVFLGDIKNIHWLGLFSGAFLAFYAFIGFEDMVNIAEEVTEVKNTMPKAIFMSIGFATLLYILISIIAVFLVPLDTLKNANTPLTLLVQQQPQYIFTGLWLVSILAGINGALVQMIMASRVIYGMSKNSRLSFHWLAKRLSYISEKTQTPIFATLMVIVFVTCLALFFPVETLAKITSTVVFSIFVLVNASLWRLKKTNNDSTYDGLSFHRWIPLVGGLSALAMLLIQVITWINA